MKIPFEIKFRPQIESGEYKVMLDCGVEAEILAWDKPGEYPIVCMAKKEGAIPFRTDNDGVAYHYPEGSNYSDLFIITPDPELTEFENAIVKIVKLCDGTCSSESDIKECIKSHSAELLELARKELVKEGTSKNEMGTMLYYAGFEDFKEEALKDLPRWSTNSDPNFKPEKYFCVGNALISPQGWSILFKDLEKLPGFKEDEK